MLWPFEVLVRDGFDWMTSCLCCLKVVVIFFMSFSTARHVLAAYYSLALGKRCLLDRIGVYPLLWFRHWILPEYFQRQSYYENAMIALDLPISWLARSF